MGIWIRSQNEEVLNNCRNLQVINDDVDYKIVERGNVCDYYFILGVYFSNKKALKVLDMIQQHIQSRVNEDMVFQMPSDDEVRL